VNKFALAPLALPLERAFLPLAGVRRGDVVVFRPPHEPHQDYIKRVIGLPGETLKIVDRVVYIRAAGAEGYVPLVEPYSTHKADPADVPDSLDNSEPFAIPADAYFVMGDNRDNSYDSREWGVVPRERIVGRGLIVYWSFDGDASGGMQTARASSGAGRILSGAGALFRDTRWSRTGRLIR
jgi:signal peptidase I